MCPANRWNKHSFACEYVHFETANSCRFTNRFVSRQENLASVKNDNNGNDWCFCVSLSPIHSVFAASPDLLYLWGPWQGEQGRLWSLHDLQQTGLQASLPRHLVSVKVCVFIYVCLWLHGSISVMVSNISYHFEMKVLQQRCWKINFILKSIMVTVRLNQDVTFV